MMQMKKTTAKNVVAFFSILPRNNKHPYKNWQLNHMTLADKR
jgi:hypothetical protein